MILFCISKAIWCTWPENPEKISSISYSKFFFCNGFLLDYQLHYRLFEFLNFFYLFTAVQCSLKKIAVKLQEIELLNNNTRTVSKMTNHKTHLKVWHLYTIQLSLNFSIQPSLYWRGGLDSDRHPISGVRASREIETIHPAS